MLVVFLVTIGLCLSSAVSAEDAPTIILAPKNQKVVENGVATFHCEATGNPSPRVYWQRNGGEMTSNNKRYTILTIGTGSVLRISRVWTWDSGAIECVADNGVGYQTTSSAMLQVYLENEVPPGYPEIVEHPKGESTWEHSDAVLSCTVKGNPEPTVTWFKDFLPVDLSDPRIDVTASGSLLIHNSRDSDEGKYECVAQNEVGVAHSHAVTLLIRIRRVPLHFTTQPEDVVVQYGGSVTLTCAAAGSPKPYVEWFHGGVNITPKDNVPIGENTMTLTSIKESSVYTCIASSDQGTIKASATVTVQTTDRSRLLRKINHTKSTFA